MEGNENTFSLFGGEKQRGKRKHDEILRKEHHGNKNNHKHALINIFFILTVVKNILCVIKALIHIEESKEIYPPSIFPLCVFHITKLHCLVHTYREGAARIHNPKKFFKNKNKADIEKASTKNRQKENYLTEQSGKSKSEGCQNV